jgi:hypothetical protein
MDQATASTRALEPVSDLRELLRLDGADPHITSADGRTADFELGFRRCATGYARRGQGAEERPARRLLNRAGVGQTADAGSASGSQ